MHYKPLLEPPASDEKANIVALREVVAAYSKNRRQAIQTIARLQASDPAGLARAALQLLVSAEEKSPGLKYAADLLMAGSLLAELLLNKDILTLDAAASLARKVTWVEPFLDVCLVRHAVAKAAGKVGAVTSHDALNVLELLDAISDCSRLWIPFDSVSEPPQRPSALEGRAHARTQQLESVAAGNPAGVGR